MIRRNMQKGMGILLAGSLAVTGVVPFRSAPQQVFAAEQTVVLNDTTANGEQSVSGGVIASGSAVASGEAVTGNKPTIQLEEKYVADNSWYVDVDNREIVKVYKENASDTGIRNYVFEGLKEGTTEVSFVYSKGQDGAIVEEYISYNVQVKADLSVTVTENNKKKENAVYVCAGEDTTTGFSLKTFVENKEILSANAVEYVPTNIMPDGTITIGGGGFYIYEMQGLKPGKTTMCFYDERDTTNIISSKNAYALEAEVKEAGTLQIQKTEMKSPLVIVKEPFWKMGDAQKLEASQYERKVTIEDETVISYVEKEEKEITSGGMSGHKQEAYTFKGLKEGSTNINISYINKEGNVVYGYRYKVEVYSTSIRVEEPVSTTVSSPVVASNQAIIELNSAPTSLYKWYYKIADSSIIKVEDAGYEPRTEDMEGGGGTQSFSVEGLKEGTTWIYFVNTRECDEEDVEYRVYKVQVNADLSVSVEQQKAKENAVYLCVEQDASTGYENQCLVEDKEILSMQRLEYFPPNSPSDDVPSSCDSGFVVYEFLGKKQGTTTVTFYKQASDTSKKTMYAYKVTVSKDKSLDFEKVVTKSSSSVKKPAKVSKVTTKRTSAKKATVSIKKVSGATGYQVTYSTDKKFKKNKKSVFTKKNKVTLKSLKKGKMYYVKVRAYRTASGTKKYGTYSKVIKIKAK